MEISITQDIMPVVCRLVVALLIISGGCGMFFTIIGDSRDGDGKIFLWSMGIFALGMTMLFFLDGGSVRL